MEFKLKPSKINGASRIKARVFFEPDGIQFVENGVTYSLIGGRSAIFFVEREQYKLVSCNAGVANGLFFRNDRDDNVRDLDWNFFKGNESFEKELQKVVNSYMKKLRKEVVMKIYNHFISKGMFGRITSELEGLLVCQIADGDIDFFVGTDDNRKSVYVMMEHSESEEETWDKASYRAYFDEFKYDLELERLSKDIIQFYDDRNAILNRFNDDIPVNAWDNVKYELSPMEEWYHEPLVITNNNEEDIRSEFIHSAFIAKHSSSMLIEKRHLKIPEGKLELRGYGFKFVNVEDIILEINSEDLIVDTGEIVEFYKDGDASMNLCIPVGDLMRMAEIRQIIRVHCPMTTESKNKKSYNKAIMKDALLNLEPLVEPVEVTRSLASELFSTIQPDWGTKELETLSKGLNMLVDYEINGAIDRLLELKDYEGLKSFMNGVVFTNGRYEYKSSK